MSDNEHISFKQRKKRHSRLIFEKNKNIDYTQGEKKTWFLGPLIEFVMREEDPFSAHIILQSLKL
jgi:hypothetical protein